MIKPSNAKPKSRFLASETFSWYMLILPFLVLFFIFTILSYINIYYNSAKRENK